jgi:uncharacterized membrane protein YciS (DUF1049 family)
MLGSIVCAIIVAALWAALAEIELHRLKKRIKQLESRDNNQ